MQYVKLGKTGLEVSRICVGCMGFGDPERWLHKWVVSEEQSHTVIRHAIEKGINFFDTANIYALGTSDGDSSPSLAAVLRGACSSVAISSSSCETRRSKGHSSWNRRQLPR